MHFWGFLVNTLTVITGSVLGLLIGSKLSESLKKIILAGLGLSTLMIGMQMALGTAKPILVVGSILGGGILGQLLKIEEWLERIGEKLKTKTDSQSTTFVAGFVTASILFCAGPMTIIGSLQDGYARMGYLIYIKSLMDGMAAIALTASMGIGVIFSAITVFVLQGGITIAGMWLGSTFAQSILNEISAAGGVLILGLGFNLLGIAKIKVGNFMPSLVIVAILAWIFLE